MKIFCFRDAVISTQQLSPERGIDEDETPRGKRYKRKGGIVQKIIFAIDLYFIVPNKVGYFADMQRIQSHFAREITKWNEGYLEYLKRPLSEAEAGESYYKSPIVEALVKNHKAFAYEISDMDELVKTFKYHGFYAKGAWRSGSGKAITRPMLPYDWNIGELNALVTRMVK